MIAFSLILSKMMQVKGVVCGSCGEWRESEGWREERGGEWDGLLGEVRDEV